MIQSITENKVSITENSVSITENAGSIMGPYEHTEAASSDADSKVQTDSYLKNREVDQLASRLSSAGMYTEESSRILANIILDGSVDVFV